jgi:nucleoside-diphosphate-sugar epimerase
VVFHLATSFIAQHETCDIPELIDSNITFGTVILEAARGASARVVLTGSAWQHFEGATYHPVSLYAATKQALFDVAAFYAHEGLDVRELTLFDTYGPDDPRRKLVPLLLEAAATGEQIDMSSGTQLIDLLYVTDVVEALIRTADQPASESTSVQQFVARSGTPVSIRGLVELIEQVVGSEINVAWGKRPDRPREMRSDWTFGHPVPGWSPRVDLASGIRSCWTARWT